MSDELYQQAIIDLARAGTRAGRLDAPDRTVSLDNPLCGDRITLDLKLADGRITDIAHRTRGCALCQASAAIVGAHAIGLGLDAARGAAETVTAFVERGGATPAAPWNEIGVFAPVRRHRSRFECVLLPFRALNQAAS
jgi:nitrogen fixation NifU-like protein